MRIMDVSHSVERPVWLEASWLCAGCCAHVPACTPVRTHCLLAPLSILCANSRTPFHIPAAGPQATARKPQLPVTPTGTSLSLAGASPLAFLLQLSLPAPWMLWSVVSGNSHPVPDSGCCTLTDSDVACTPPQPDSHSGVSQGVTGGHVPVPKVTRIQSMIQSPCLGRQGCPGRVMSAVRYVVRASPR